jgi:dTDP-4-amino-4,6-dideoxygalactose transaminase
VERYEEFAARAGKLLLFDSATCFGSQRAGKPFGALGDGEIFSFHHTKPCGFGEGGCVVIPVALEDTFRSLINFGLYKKIDTGARSTNGKISDVAAAFILDRVRRHEVVGDMHRREFRRYANLAQALRLELLIDGGQEGVFPSLAPILFPHPVLLEDLNAGPMVAHKYYRPLASRPRADALYTRIVCFPCHTDMAKLSDDQLRGALERVLTTTKG